MNQLYFVETKKRFRDAGLEIVEAEYHPEAFGSCYIEVKASPNCRFIYDGKDKWFVVQVKTDETFNRLPVWRNIWTGENAGETQYQIAFEKTLSYCRSNA